MALAAGPTQNEILSHDPADTNYRLLDALAAATPFYPLAFAGINTANGYAKKFDGTDPTCWFDGVWDMDTVDNHDAVAAGVDRQRVSKPFIFRTTVPAGGLTDANVRQPVYAIPGNDYQVSLTPPATGYTDSIGTIEAVAPGSSTVVYVKFRYKNQNSQGGGGLSVLGFPVDLPSITGSQNVVAGFTPGFAGRIRSVQFVVNKPATTAGKAATLTPKVNATGVTGGVVGLTSANCTPMGNTVAGTAVTGANTFGATDTITIAASAVTAFAEGSGTLQIVVEANANS